MHLSYYYFYLLLCFFLIEDGPNSVISSSSSHQSEGLDSYDLEQVNNIFRKLSLERYGTDENSRNMKFVGFLRSHTPVCVLCVRPFRPSLSSFSRISSSLKPVQEVSFLGDNLLKDITLVGGNESGIFISSVQPGTNAEKAGLKEGYHLLLVQSSFDPTFF